MLIFLSITAFLNPKSLGFLFLRKLALTWGVKCEKLNPEILREFITEASKIVPESGKQAIENYRRYLYFSE